MFNRAIQFNFPKISVLPVLGILISVMIFKTSTAQFQDVGEIGYFSVELLDKSYIQKHQIAGIFIQNRIKNPGEKIKEGIYSVRLNFNSDGNLIRQVDFGRGDTFTKIYTYNGNQLIRVERFSNNQSTPSIENHFFTSMNEEIIQEITQSNPSYTRRLFYDSGKLIQERQFGNCTLYHYHFDTEGNLSRKISESTTGNASMETNWTWEAGKISSVSIEKTLFDFRRDFYLFYLKNGLLTKLETTNNVGDHTLYEFFYNKEGILESALESNPSQPFYFTITNYSYEFY